MRLPIIGVLFLRSHFYDHFDGPSEVHGRGMRVVAIGGRSQVNKAAEIPPKVSA